MPMTSSRAANSHRSHHTNYPPSTSDLTTSPTLSNSSSIYQNLTSNSYTDLNCLSSSYVPPNANISYNSSPQSRPDRDNSAMYRQRETVARGNQVQRDLHSIRSSPLRQSRPHAANPVSSSQMHSSYQRLWHEQQNRAELLRRRL